MNERITVLYTNIYDANSVVNSLKTNGIKSARLNTTEFGLHIGIDRKQVLKKYPGAILSTVVKLEVEVNPESRSDVLSVVESSFGVID